MNFLLKSVRNAATFVAFAYLALGLLAIGVAPQGPLAQFGGRLGSWLWPIVSFYAAMLLLVLWRRWIAFSILAVTSLLWALTLPLTFQNIFWSEIFLVAHTFFFSAACLLEYSKSRSSSNEASGTNRRKKLGTSGRCGKVAPKGPC